MKSPVTNTYLFARCKRWTLLLCAPFFQGVPDSVLVFLLVVHLLFDWWVLRERKFTKCSLSRMLHSLEIPCHWIQVGCDGFSPCVFDSHPRATLDLSVQLFVVASDSSLSWAFPSALQEGEFLRRNYWKASSSGCRQSPMKPSATRSSLSNRVLFVWI